MHTEIKDKQHPINDRFKQGGVLSPVLFSLTLEKVVKKGRLEQSGVKMGKTTIGLLVYADNVVLLAESEKDVK